MLMSYDCLKIVKKLFFGQKEPKKKKKSISISPVLLISCWPFFLFIIWEFERKKLYKEDNNFEIISIQGI